jgi:hypothetical protein
MKFTELAAISLVCLLGLALLILNVLAPQDKCQQKIVRAVGGCRADGMCGVRFEDGTFGTAMLPVVGWTYSSCKEGQKGE